MKPNKKHIDQLRASGLFAEDWYQSTYPDVTSMGMDPIEHYLWIGARLNRNPSPHFNTKSYVLEEGDRLGKLNPLLHYWWSQNPQLIESEPEPNVLPEHRADLSVVASSTEPEFSDPTFRNVEPSSAPADELQRLVDEIRPSFDIEYYLRKNPDVAKAKVDPIRHYLNNGWKEGRDPSPEFDTKWYLLQYRDVAKAGINPFVHYVRGGKDEGRRGKEPSFRIERSTEFLRSFQDFSGFLCESLINDTLMAPFKEEDRRAFATMEKIRKELCHTTRESATNALVSIVMPAFNRADIIGEAIDSVIGQSYPFFELIIVDDGSIDNTVEIVKNYSDPRITLIETSTNRGASAARNTGLATATGVYVTYLDSDNTMHPDFLLAMVGAFIKLPRADLCYCGQMLFRSRQNVPYAIRFGAYNPSLIENKNYIDMNAIMHTREALRRIGRFDENLKRLVDWDFILRASESLNVYSVPALLSNYRVNFSKGPSITASENVDDARAEIRKNQALRKRARLAKYAPAFPTGITVIIPNYQAAESLRKCVDSILADAPVPNVHIVIVDNASDETVRSYLIDLEKSQAQTRVILNDVNYGFTYAVNQGIEIADPSHDIVLLNNDAILVPGALMAMQAAALESADVGLVVPRQILPADTPTLNTHVPSANPAYECDVSLSWHHKNVVKVPCFHDGSRVELSFAAFFCVYIKRDVLNAVHNLDAEFGRHYRSDQVFCAMVRDYLGLKIVYTPHSHVYHLHQQSTHQLRSTNKTQFEEMFTKNRWPRSLERELGYGLGLWDYRLDDDVLTQTTPRSALQAYKPNRVCLLAGYDGDGIVDPYVVALARELSRFADVFYLADNAMRPGELEKLSPFVKGAWAERHGQYDFGSYSRLAKLHVGWERILQYDELLLVNDSGYLLRSFDHVFSKMDATDCDWWGLQATGRMTAKKEKIEEDKISLHRIKYDFAAAKRPPYLDGFHVGSYFLALRKKVVSDATVQDFFNGVTSQESKSAIIRNYEIGLTRLLLSNGFEFSTFINYLYPFHPLLTERYFELVTQGFPLLKRAFFKDNPFGVTHLETWQNKLLAASHELNPELFAVIAANLERSIRPGS